MTPVAREDVGGGVGSAWQASRNGRGASHRGLTAWATIPMPISRRQCAVCWTLHCASQRPSRHSSAQASESCAFGPMFMIIWKLYGPNASRSPDHGHMIFLFGFQRKSISIFKPRDHDQRSRASQPFASDCRWSKTCPSNMYAKLTRHAPWNGQTFQKAPPFPKGGVRR